MTVKETLNLIYCDNDELMQMIWDLEAKKCDVQLTMFSHPEKLLNMLKDIPKDTVFCLDYDYGKGAMNGVEVAKIINSQRPSAKVYLCTGYLPGQIDIHGARLEICGKGPEIIKMLLSKAGQ